MPKYCPNISTLKIVDANTPGMPPQMIGQPYPLISPCIGEKCAYWFEATDDAGNKLGDCLKIMSAKAQLDTAKFLFDQQNLIMELIANGDAEDEDEEPETESEKKESKLEEDSPKRD